MSSRISAGVDDCLGATASVSWAASILSPHKPHTTGGRVGTETIGRQLDSMHYNFGRPHQTLTKKYGRPTTAAMAAGIADHPWSLTQIAELLD